MRRFLARRKGVELDERAAADGTVNRKTIMSWYPQGRWRWRNVDGCRPGPTPVCNRHWHRGWRIQCTYRLFFVDGLAVEIGLRRLLPECIIAAAAAVVTAAAAVAAIAANVDAKDI